MLETSLKLSYAWVPSPYLSSPQFQVPASSTLQSDLSPKTLTTWHNSSSSYKTLSVPPPSSATPNSTWHLALFVSPPFSHKTSSSPPWELGLHDILSRGGREDGEGALPVLSEGVRFVSPTSTAAPIEGKKMAGAGGKKAEAIKAKGAGKGIASGGKGGRNSNGRGGGGNAGEKQDRIRRVFDFSHSSCQNVTQEGQVGEKRRKLVFTEQTSFDLDKVRQLSVHLFSC
jgi:hypothetical protein